MSDYFVKTNKSCWNIFDAYKNYEQSQTNKTTQQKLDRFYQFLLDQNRDDNINIDPWLNNWSAFYRKMTNSEKSSGGQNIDCSNATINTFNANNKREGDIYIQSAADISEKKRRVINKDSDEVIIEAYDEEEDEDNEPRSDLSGDYHPNRTKNYILEEVHYNDDSTKSGESTSVHDDTWLVGDFNVIDNLKRFKTISHSISPKKLSDLRLLAINSIYLFTLLDSSSITNYMDLYDNADLDEDKPKKILKTIKDDLQISEGEVTLSSNIINWTHELSKQCITINDWYDIQDVTIPFLVAANNSKNKTELIAANIIHKLALNFCNRQPDYKLEDSFVHNFISAIFDTIFQSDPILSHQWANGSLNKDIQFKPDFVVFLKHSMNKYDLAISEIKPPANSNSNNNGESDLVKIGKEMTSILNSLIREGVEAPIVCGVLFKGLKMTTFKMDLKYPHVYRLIELSNTTLFDNLQEIPLLPNILANILQVKNIARKTAIKTKKRVLSKLNGEDFVHSPPISYIVNSRYNLRRASKKKQ